MKWFLIFLLLSSPALIFCKDKPKNYISLFLASSAPLGKYASAKDVGNGGFATTGGSISIDGARFYCNSGTGNFGLAGTISVGSHNLNQVELQKGLQEKGFNARFNDSSKWMASTMMFGPVYALKNGNFTVEFRMLGGLFFGRAPDVVIQNNETALPENYRKFNNNLYDCVGALGYQLGTVLHYQATKHLQFSLKAAFYHAKPKYKIQNSVIDESNGLVTKDFTFQQKTSAFDLGLGAGYSF